VIKTLKLVTGLRELEMMGRDKNLEVGNRLEVLQEAYEQMKIQLDELK